MAIEFAKFTSTTKVAENVVVPEVEVFEHGDFNSAPQDQGGFAFRTTLDLAYVGDDMNDKISSIIVFAGRWEFWKDASFSGWPPGANGPLVLDVGQHDLPGIWNDTISSFRCI